MEFTLYKPNKNQTGGAVKFNVHKSGKFSFMKAAPQIGPMGGQKIFGWEDDTSINVKMGLTDLGTILAVLTGFMDKPDRPLFHQTDLDNKIIEFTHVPERKGFALKISHKVQGNSQANSVFVPILYAEAMILKVYIEDAIRQILASNVWSAEEN